MSYDLLVTPSRWTSRGEALARDERGLPLLVFGAIPGEICDVWVQHEGEHQSVGLWRGSRQRSRHRVSPGCGRWAVCGGCPLMHMDGEGQWAARSSLVRAHLDDHGLDDVVIGAQHDCPQGLDNYRHVVKVGAGYSDQGSARLGAWGRRSRNIVPIPKCPVATETLRKTMSSLSHYARALDIRPYDQRNDRGVLRSAVLRHSRTTGEVLVTLIVARRIRALQELAEALANDVTDVVGVWAHINSEPGNGMFTRDENGKVWTRALVGKSWIEEDLDGITYRIGPGDFFQTNPSTAEVLYKRTMQLLDLQRDEAFLDLYCGVGGLALQGARTTGWAMGIEEVEGAVLHARDAARRNGLSAQFLCGEVREELPQVQKLLGDRGCAISVNPARRGLEEDVIEGIVALKPSRVAYISCNPQAFARDLRVFREAGLQIGEVELFDMFPNTAHVECLVVLHDPTVKQGEVRAPRRRVVRR